MFTRRSRSQRGVPCRPDFSVNMLTGSVGTDSFGRSTLESTQLSERCRPLRERVVLVDGLFGLGLHSHPRGVRHLRISLQQPVDRKSTRLNSSHVKISYAVFCLKKKKN